MKYIVLLAVLFYLVVQSAEDIKTMTVPVFYNDVALWASATLYAFDLLRSGIFPSIETVLAVSIIVFLWKAGLYGRGDMKAMCVILLTLRYVGFYYPHPDCLLFLIAIFTANVFFLGVWFFKKRKKSKGEKRFAYFPALTVGYLISMILGGLCYG